jgi:type I restriction enzyme R subunit
MAVTGINSEDRLVQATFAAHLKDVLGWESVYAWNEETFGPGGTLGRKDTTEAVLTRDLRAALERLNPDLPPSAIADALRALTVHDFSRSLIQHNQDFARAIRNGVPVSWRDANGQRRDARVRVIDFDNAPGANRFLAVRELKLTGLRTPNYNRRADLVCFVNGLPLVFIELKAVYKNIRAGFDGNLRDYMDENVIAHAFHHNAFLIVANGDRARYGSITSEWDHFAEWKRQEETDKGKLDAEALLDGMLAHDRLLDMVENFILFDESKAGKTRKVVARNHQVLGVNRAVASVAHQEELKREFPPEKRLQHRVIELPLEKRAIADQKRRSGAEKEGLSALPSLIPEGADQHHRAGTPGPRAAWRVLAHAGQRQELFHGLLRREGAPQGARQFHLPADDRPAGPRQPDLQDFRGLQRSRERHASRCFGRGPRKAAEGKPPLHLQPDPQVQSGCGPEKAL